MVKNSQISPNTDSEMYLLIFLHQAAELAKGLIKKLFSSVKR
jgi:hypothetical protein